MNPSPTHDTNAKKQFASMGESIAAAQPQQIFPGEVLLKLLILTPGFGSYYPDMTRC
jgi:hypothetical protein